MSTQASAPLPAHSADLPPFRIGEFTVVPARNLVAGPRGEATLQPRVMHVLACLAAREGAVTRRLELLEAVWGDAVVCEDSVTRAVSDLRLLLDDAPAAPRYIETIRKGGYRLAEKPEWLTGGGNGDEALQPPRRRGVTVAVAGALTTLIVVALTVVAVLKFGSALRPDPGPLAGTPLTAYPGVESQPAISPDGGRVAFAWAESPESGPDLWILRTDGGRRTRLTEMAGRETYPAWSPDGDRIAFFHAGDETGLYVVSAEGGPPRRLLALDELIFGLDWSPDGGALVFGANRGSRTSRLQLLDLNSLAERTLTEDTPQTTCDYHPAFSPDGAVIAFIRTGPLNEQDLFTVPSGGGPLARLTRIEERIEGLDWLPGGDALVAGILRPGRSGLWRIAYPDGELSLLPTLCPTPTSPSVAVLSGALVFADHDFTDDVWRADVRGDTAGPLLESTRRDYAAAYSPDGARIAFLSTRSGRAEVWLSDAEGSDPRRVSDAGDSEPRAPWWSPDGSRLAWASVRGGRSRIVVLAVDAGTVRVVTPEIGELGLCGWTNDGEGFYCERPSARGWEFLRVSAEGKASAALVADGTWLLGEDAAGRLIHTRHGAPGIWARAGDDDEPQLLVPGTTCTGWTCLAWREGEIWFLGRTFTGRTFLGRHRTADDFTEVLRPVPGARGARLSIAPDGATALFEHVARAETDLVLVADPGWR